MFKKSNQANIPARGLRIHDVLSKDYAHAVIFRQGMNLFDSIVDISVAELTNGIIILTAGKEAIKIDFLKSNGDCSEKVLALDLLKKENEKINGAYSFVYGATYIALVITTEFRIIAFYFDSKNNTLQRNLVGHSETIVDVRHYKSYYIISASNDRSIIMWDVLNEQQVWMIHNTMVFPNPVTSLAISTDLKFLIYSTSYPEVYYQPIREMIIIKYETSIKKELVWIRKQAFEATDILPLGLKNEVVQIICRNNIFFVLTITNQLFKMAVNFNNNRIEALLLVSLLSMNIAPGIGECYFGVCPTSDIFIFVTASESILFNQENGEISRKVHGGNFQQVMSKNILSQQYLSILNSGTQLNIIKFRDPGV